VRSRDSSFLCVRRKLLSRAEGLRFGSSHRIDEFVLAGVRVPCL